MSGILVSVVATMVLGSQPVWHHDYTVAYRTAQSANRPLLIVFENSTDPQQLFQPVSATKNEAEQQLLGKYVLCRFDVSNDYGKYWSDRFRTTSVPYAVITNPGVSRIVFRKAGKISSDDWVTTLTSYQNVQVQQTSTVNYSSRQFFSNAGSYFGGSFGSFGGFGGGFGGGC